MGVDWYPCAICGETFPDCGHYGHCSECESKLCGRCLNEQVSKYGNPEEGSKKESWFGSYSADKCDLCSGLIIYDKDILDYLLNINSLTKDEVIDIIKNERGIK